MFGAEHRIIHGYGCDKCRIGPTDGKCCPSPITFWCTETDDGDEITWSTWPTVSTPFWCEDHDRACSESPCPLCAKATPPIDRGRTLAPAESPPLLDSDVDPDAKPGDGVYGDDPTPPRQSCRETERNPLASDNQEEADMASKRKTSKRSPKTHAKANGASKAKAPPAQAKGPKDRTGLIEEAIDGPTLKKLGKDLAHETVDLEKLVAKKKHFCSQINDDIRGKEQTVSELAEQVDTGKRWVTAQGSIPGVDASA